MPDHVHILLEINREKGWKVWAQGWKMANYLKGRSAAVGGHAVGGGRDCPLPHDLKLNTRKFKIKTLPELMGAMKSRASYQIRKAGSPDFAWQRSYYDRVVRNRNEFKIIKNYIHRNPKNWQGIAADFSNFQIGS